MKVYHGTISTCAENIIKNGINLKKGKSYVDFGQGFYTTTSKRFAVSTALNKCEKTNRYKKYEFCKPMVLSFEYNEEKAKKLNYLEFKYANLEWAMFVINNRNGKEYMEQISSDFSNLYSRYDIVSGTIADDEISSIANDLKLLGKKISPIELTRIQYKYKTNQFSFHTDKSLDCIKLADCDIINKRKGVEQHD